MIAWPFFQPMVAGSRVKEHASYKHVSVVYLVHIQQGTSAFLPFSVGIYSHLVVPNIMTNEWLIRQI